MPKGSHLKNTMLDPEAGTLPKRVAKKLKRDGKMSEVDHSPQGPDGEPSHDWGFSNTAKRHDREKVKQRIIRARWDKERKGNEDKVSRNMAELILDDMSQTTEDWDKKYRDFIENILNGQSQVQAYIEVFGEGPKSRTRRENAVLAYKLLQRGEVRSYMLERRYQVEGKLQCTLEWWTMTNMAIVSGDSGHAETPASRSAAMERLGRFLGAYQKDRANASDLSIKQLMEKLPEALKVLDGGSGAPLPKKKVKPA